MVVSFPHISKAKADTNTNYSLDTLNTVISQYRLYRTHLNRTCDGNN